MIVYKWWYSIVIVLCVRLTSSESVLQFLIKPETYRIPLKIFTTNPDLSLSCYDDGSYAVTVHGVQWLKSAPSFFNIDGQMYSLEDGTLKLQKISEDDGEDSLGRWESMEFWWLAGDTPIITSFKHYPDISGVIFGQSFPKGARNTSVHQKDLIISGFPGFTIDDSDVDLGYLAYGYIFVGNMGKSIGRWAPANFTMKEGRNSGPLALYDRSGQHALFISPFNQFMSASAIHQKLQGRYYWGVMGSVTDIPEQFSFSTILFYGQGINHAISGWGDVMRKYYKKLPHYREADYTNNYLSYWSDNGAYYVNYYVKGGLIQNLTYEDAMLGVRRYSNYLDIPYRSVQYSVWFKQGKGGGNGLWAANPLLFPNGMKYMFSKTGLPATAHSRYWSSDTPYARQNGGKYNFFVDNLHSLPYDEQFWTDLFAQSQQFGFKTYMQDWLNIQFDSMEITTNNTHVARTWLMQMGEGAKRNGITIQYCMSESRHILQSLEIPAVTQTRASDDYQPNDPLQWRIGISSMFAHAVGLAPFKDTFWTTETQPHNYYKGTEPYPDLHVIIATLSTGAVGPGDMINGTNATLLMRCCASDGLILKPSKPAMIIDRQLIQTSFRDGSGPHGELWTTYSDIDQWRFGIIFATDMHNNYSIGLDDAHFGPQFPTSKVYTSAPDFIPREFDDTNRVIITQKCTKANVCLYYTTPVFKYGEKELLILGELTKIVPISPQRILSIQWDSTDFKVKVKGAAMEKVTLTYILGGKRSEVTCTMSSAGTAVLSIRHTMCYPL